jgi:phage baseplate assembly protein W
VADGDKSFLGTGWGFPPAFRLQGRQIHARMAREEDDIRESLRILLATSPGERVMQPDYGCGLRSKVFEHLDESAVTEIKDIVQRAVLFHEARITLNEVQVDTAEWGEGRLALILDYTVRSTNTRTNMVYPFYFLHVG